MDFRLVVRLSTVPLMIGLVGAAAAYILAGFASAMGFAGGAALVALAMLVSGGFFVRVRAFTAGQVLFRLAISTALKWAVLMAGAWLGLVASGLPPAAFTLGVIAGLLSTLFNKGQGSRDVSST